MEMIPLNSKAIVKAKDYEAFFRTHQPTLSQETLDKNLASIRRKEQYKEKAVFKRLSTGVITISPATQEQKKDARVWPQTIKMGDEEEIDFDKPSKEKVKRFLLKMIELRKKKKALTIPLGKANAITVKGEQLHKMLETDPMISERSKAMINYKYPVNAEYKVYKTKKSVMVEKLPDAWEAEMNRLEKKLYSDLRTHLNENPDVLAKLASILKGTK